MINLNVYTLNEYDTWKEQFENLRLKIITKKEKLWRNYTLENLDLAKQDEATIITDYNEIIAFSFLFSRSYWQNAARCLNRFWISPKYRKHTWTTHHQMTNILGVSICDIMFEKQIARANYKNYDFVFVSREYPALAWQHNFVKKNQKWNCSVEHLWNVVQGNQKECWQHCVWQNLGKKTNFPFKCMTLQDFKQRFSGAQE